MDGVERALEEMATKARGEVANGLEEVEKAARGINQPLEQVGNKARNVGELGEEAKRSEQDMENLKNQVLDFFSITNTI
jgi:methyl-accepting chemotaxis protein